MSWWEGGLGRDWSDQRGRGKRGRKGGGVVGVCAWGGAVGVGCNGGSSPLISLRDIECCPSIRFCHRITMRAGAGWGKGNNMGPPPPHTTFNQLPNE